MRARTHVGLSFDCRLTKVCAEQTNEAVMGYIWRLPPLSIGREYAPANRHMMPLADLDLAVAAGDACSP
jgi:hypothetical protein